MADDDLRLEDLTADDDLRDGAALDSSEDEAELARLPRVLRHALRAAAGRDANRRLAAEIVEVAPDLETATRAWLAALRLPQTLELAASLDRLAVTADDPALRGLADSVRLVALPLPRPERGGAADYLRALRSLVLARDACGHLSDEVRAKIDRVVLGWAAAPLLSGHEVSAGWRPAIVIAADLIDDMTAAIAKAAVTVEQRRVGTSPANAARCPDEAPCPADHVIVCRRDVSGPATGRANEAARPHAHVINAPVRLIACPDLGPVRDALLADYPYAATAIDFCLAGLMNRRFVQFEPLLLLGPPGVGKTRFARRLAELLHVGLWRIDGTQADGGAITGTDRRWSTAAPCAPFLAISRHQHANPMLLVDEIDKAATRADYGRLWDALVALSERENTHAYSDPGLGVPVDVSWVSYLATANSTNGIPAPLLDRYRIVEFAAPRPDDLDVLAEGFRRDLAGDRRLDPRFVPPLAPDERAMLARQWQGGSARRLRRLLDVVWRARDKALTRH